MILLQLLVNRLQESVQENLNRNQIVYFDDSETIDLLATLLSSSGTKKKKEKIFLESTELEFSLKLKSPHEFEKLKEHNYIMEAADSRDNSSYHISFKGLAKYTVDSDRNIVQSIGALDHILKEQRPSSIKDEEKVIVLYLYAHGAIGPENKITTSNWGHRELDKNYEILKTVAEEAYEAGFIRQINWTNRKNINFRKFFTTTDALPKTHLFSSNPRNTYHLALNEPAHYKRIASLLIGQSGEIAVNELHRLDKLIDKIQIILQVEFNLSINIETKKFSV